MLESVCRNYCSNSMYRYLGQYFWPEKLVIPTTWLSYMTESAASIPVMAAGGMIGVGAVCGGIYWWKSHVHAQNSVSSPKSHLESSSSSTSKEKSKEILKATTFKEVPPKIPHKFQTCPEITRKPLLAPQILNHFPKPEVIQSMCELPKPEFKAGERFPADLIVNAYITLHGRTDLRLKRLRGRNEQQAVKQEVLETLKLPTNECYPQDEKSCLHFDKVVRSLNMPQLCISPAQGTALRK